MKLLLLSLSLFALAPPAFAVSVCLLSVPDTYGEKASLTCDGKTLSLFEVSEGWQGKQTKALADAITKGYRIASEVRDAGDQYTLVKE